MALIPSIIVLENDNQETIQVYENTGAYDASTNGGGYGTPNPAVGDVTAATILFSLRGSDGVFVDYETVNVYNALPNITETPFEISAEDAGFGTDSTFPDGIYMLTYTVSGSGFSAEYIYYVVFKKAIECCYSEKALEFSQCSCNCDSIGSELANIAFYLGQLEIAEAAGNLTWQANLLSKLANLCEDSGCGCN